MIHKFMFVLLLIAMISLLTVGVFGIYSIVQSGDTIISDSGEILKTKTSAYLMDKISQEADTINNTFSQIELLIHAEGDYAYDIYYHPENYTYIEQYTAEAYEENSTNKPPDIKYSDKYKRNVSMNYMAIKIAPNISKEDVSDVIQRYSRMISFFKSAVKQYTDIRWIYIGTPEGVHFSYPGHGYNVSFDPRLRPWYRLAVRTGKLSWSKPYVDAGGLGLMVTVSKPVYNDTGALIGVVATDITVDTMNKNIINLEIGESGYPILIDRDGDVIARPNYTAEDVRWDETFVAENLLNTTNTELSDVVRDMINGSYGIREIDFDNTRKIIVYAPVKCTGWSLCAVLPISDVNQPIVSTKSKLSTYIDNTVTWMYLISLIVMGIVVIVSMVFAKALISPINELTSSADRISRGNIDVKIKKQSSDEIGQLADTFNRMVDEIRRYRYEVEKHSKELETKIHERTMELENAYRELKKLDKVKSEFIDVAAHELRTPIVAIKTFIELIRNEKLGAINTVQREKLEMISKNIEHLVSIVEEMIDVSRIEAGKLEMRFEPVDISELIDIVMKNIAMMADEKNQTIRVNVSKNLYVNGDMTHLTKVYRNLILNAIKYTPENGEIEINAWKENEYIHTTVRDTGIGIPEDKIESIFDKFNVGDYSLSGKKRGIGLGLTIAKNIVMQHHGTIWAESKLGKGSVFHVKLPVWSV